MKRRLSNIDRLSVLRCDAEIRAVNAKRALVVHSLTQYLRDIDPNGVVKGMETELASLLTEKERWQGEYKAVLERVLVKTGINLTSYTFDDCTGELSSMTEER